MPSLPQARLEAADAGEAVIIEKHDIQFAVFLERRDDFLRHHEVRTIANEDVDVAAGSAIFTPIRRRSRTPCRNSHIPGDSPGARVRHNLCRSPGKLPAAQTIMSRHLQ